MILKTISHLAGVSTLVEVKAVGDAILIKDVVQLGRIDSESVLVADINRDPSVLAKVSSVLIHERQGRIRRPSCQNIRLCYSVLHRQIKIERWIFWIG